MKIVIIMEDSITELEATTIMYDGERIMIGSDSNIASVKAERPTFDWIQKRILTFVKEIRIDCRGERPTILTLVNNNNVDKWVD